jgi:hypothetical protein
VWLCLLSLPLGCSSYDDVGFDEAGSEVSEDGENLGSLEQPIGGGTLVLDGENVLNMFGPAVRLGGGGSFCSGVKIADKKFLTAAHCFSDSRTTVQITNSLNGVLPATPFTILRQFRHPSHKIGSSEGDLVENGLYDLKVIEIAETTNIPVAKITPLAAAVGTSGYISIGYGCDGQTPGNGNQKQQGEFNAVLGATTAHVHYISENRARTVCDGDSGGPLFRLVNGEMQVTGINAGTATFTRVENTFAWIANPAVNVFTNNSVGSFMNLASASATSFAPLNCAAMQGNGGTSTLDVKLEECDGQAALYNGGKSVTWSPIAGNTGAGFQKIINFANGSCLGVDGAATADANVSAIPCAASTAALTLRQSQAWRFVDVGQAALASVGTPAIRAFNVVNERSGRCLSTTGSTAAGIGSDVRQSACDSTRRDQKWVFTR